jgi:inner membrane protein
MTLEPPVLPSIAARRRSWFIKIASICGLLALLHIPLWMTHGVLRERQNYQAQAIDEICNVWGGPQRITGPILAVPYTYKGSVTRTKLVANQWVQVDEPGVCSAVAYFLPEDLRVDGAVEPEIRRRGIYDAVVYTARLKFTGALRPDFGAAGIEAEKIDWEKARVLFGASDLHGLRSLSALHVADKESAFEAADGGANSLLPLAANVSVTGAGKFDFTFDVVLQGSGNVTLAPVGKNTTTVLRSPWRDPSFTGAWLPIERHVAADGFTAEWKVAPFSRGFPQSWTSRVTTTGDITKKIDAAAFGVRFARGIDSYSMVERAQKYGVLFFVLVFAVFFLFEVTAELRIHPLQYAMVGAALCLFFLGFLALTEFWTTATAYAVAAGVCTALVSAYSWSFLRAGWRTLVVLVGLITTYGYLYFVLQSQDYALVAGTLALFAALALAMFCTRRINWYSLEAIPAKAAA